MPSRAGFTLIELLVVIAIIAVLAVVVVLVLNPAGLLQEARDSNRLSDMATLNSAIGLSLADNPSESLGSPNVLYSSVPDPSATSSLGDQCQGLGLPALPAGWAYQCAASSTFRKTDGTGWVPVNFSQNTFGSSLAQLPLDPVNSTSTGLYYTYVTDGQQFEVTSLFESQKYKAQFAQSPIVPSYPEVNGKGSSLSLNPLWSPSGLVGYWPMDEGTGSSTADQSGNGSAGAWSGTPAGTSGYYSAGKVGAYAGSFDGNTDTIAISQNQPQVMNFGNGNISISFWIYSNNFTGIGGNIRPIEFAVGSNSSYFFINVGKTGTSPTNIAFDVNDSLSNFASVAANSIPINGWFFMSFVMNRQSQIGQAFLNGLLVSTSSISNLTGSVNPAGDTWSIGAWKGSAFNGLIDDVRIYNRALSAAEIQALYNAQR